MMQKIPYAEFNDVDAPLEVILTRDDYANYGYFVVCDTEYTDEGKKIAREYQFILEKEKMKMKT